jgi:adenylosuccinate lyase
MKRNMEITHGLVFSQRVMLALIDKGLTRQEAYKIVQHNAMKSWNGKGRFLSLLKKDARVNNLITTQELQALFDYNYYLKHIDDIFIRLGLTRNQWSKRQKSDSGHLAPETL